MLFLLNCYSICLFDFFVTGIFNIICFFDRTRRSAHRRICRERGDLYKKIFAPPWSTIKDELLLFFFLEVWMGGEEEEVQKKKKKSSKDGDERQEKKKVIKF